VTSGDESAKKKGEFTLARLDPLKTEFILNNIYNFGSHLTGNTYLRYKEQPVNAVQGEKSLFITRPIRNTQMHCVDRIADL
jgi:hypothetical protein